MNPDTKLYPHKLPLLAALLWLLILVAGCSRLGGRLEAPSEEGPSDEESEPAELQQPAAEQPEIMPLVEGSRISPANPLIRYTGRFDFSDPTGPRFDWPAVTIEAAFEGTSIAALLEDGLNSYDITVDGQASVLRTQPGTTRYPLASGLSDGSHQVRLTKRTETFYGTPRFLGFELDEGRELLPLSPPPDRRIEFVGDSITAGYGVEGDSPTCIFSTETENAALTFAAQTAEQLNAAYSIIAVSGLGVVRNYNADGSLSAGTMLTYYGRTLANDAAENWQFDSWVPQAVVINLGTNDYSTAPHPAGEVFLLGYTDLLFKVRARYPDAHIFAIAGPIMVDPAEDTIRSVVAQMNEVLHDDRVHFVPIQDTLELTAVDYGCDWHPNQHGQAKIAEQLVPAMKDVLGW